MPKEKNIIVEILKHLPGEHDQVRHAGLKGVLDAGKKIGDKVDDFIVRHGGTTGTVLLAIQAYILATSVYSNLDANATIKNQMTREGKFTLKEGDITLHADKQKDIDSMKESIDSMPPTMRRFATSFSRNIYLSAKPFSTMYGFVPYIDHKQPELGGVLDKLWINTDPKRMFGIIGPKGLDLFENRKRTLQSVLVHESAHNLWARTSPDKRANFISVVGFREKLPLFGYPGTKRPDGMANEVFGHMTGEVTLYPNRIRKNYGPKVVSAWEELTGIKLDDVIAESSSIKKSATDEGYYGPVRIENKNGVFYVPGRLEGN